MCRTCNNVDAMPKMIQLRHVPDTLHRKLKARAAKQKISLSDYLLQEVTVLAELPPMADTFAAISRLPSVAWKEPVVKSVRKMREGR